MKNKAQERKKERNGETQMSKAHRKREKQQATTERHNLGSFKKFKILTNHRAECRKSGI